MIRWLSAFVVLILCTAAPAVHAQATTGPSFACAGATGAAAIVCTDKDLSAEDRTLSTLYAATRVAATGAGASNEQTAQRTWLHDLDSQCAKGTAKAQHDCVKTSYDTRVEMLAQAALFTDHAAAMTALRHLTPDDAPIYEAIWLYSTIDDAKQRQTKVAEAVAPVYAAFDDGVRQAIKALGGPETAQEAASSDASFGLFVDLATVEGGHSIGWPCAALLKRPGLIAAMGSLYGSTKDNVLPYDDCSDTMPPAPAFTAFADKPFDGVPECDGTIRFGSYRTYSQYTTAALLHRPDFWAKIPVLDGGKPEARFRAKHATEIARARAGLAGYYVQAFKIDAKAADRDAGAILDRMIGQAYNPC